MVKLKRVQAKEYSKCLAKDFWMDSGSFGSYVSISFQSFSSAGPLKASEKIRIKKILFRPISSKRKRKYTKGLPSLHL